jgi:Putative zinc-finger
MELNMKCWSTRRRIADYVDGRLRESERSRMAAHLHDCAACSLRFEQIRSVRAALGRLPSSVSPARLSTALRVKASQERQAALETNGSRWRRIWDPWKLRLDDVMRPLTLPATGGLLSSLILFAAFAFTVESTASVVNYEVPVLNAIRADANLVPLQLQSSVTLTMSLDENGRITDYTARGASDWFVGDATRLQGNNIALPSFRSVLELPQPVSSDIRIKFTPILFRQ